MTIWTYIYFVIVVKYVMYGSMFHSILGSILSALAVAISELLCIGLGLHMHVKYNYNQNYCLCIAVGCCLVGSETDQKCKFVSIQQAALVIVVNPSILKGGVLRIQRTRLDPPIMLLITVFSHLVIFI